ncbi:MAG: DUF1624 domain-containing protein [Gemmatimonadales bacterium]
MSSRARIESVDLLRGVIMILMALDHTRDYFGVAGVNPTDPATTTVALFFTRWVTHFCAPVFFLLTGTGAFLALRRRTIAQLSRFLFTRGLWLIFVEIVLLRCFGWQFNFDYRVTMLTVLWGLGWAMIVLSALVHLPPRVVAALGALMIVTHNLLDSVRASTFGAFAPLWSVLHAPAVIYSDGRHMVFVAYALIPWIGVTAVGYGLGQLYRWEPVRRRALLFRLGLALTVAFVMLRAVNLYGDPLPWSLQRSPVFTALSFLDTTKYPPSLLFLLMTLGPALLFLRAMDGGMPRALRPALVIGKVPMFYYVLHVPLIHLVAVIVCVARYGSAHWMVESPSIDRFPVTQPPGWPVPLPVVWLIWVGIVVMLYPLCRWFAGVKAMRTDWWLSYI